MEFRPSQRFVSVITRDTLALILAGGRGTRLGALTSHRVKPAVPFGGKFRIIDFALSNCINSGIRRVGVLTQYKAHSLIRHLHQGWGFLRGEFGEFIELLPAQQRTGPSWYSGTADAIYQNIDIIRSHEPQFVLVLGGDHVYKMDYGTMLGYHVDNGADITVGCAQVSLEQARGFGVMAVDDTGRVVRFDEKPEHPEPMPGSADQALGSMGIYVFNTDYLIDCLEQDARNPNSSRDFGRDVLPRAIYSDAVYAFPFRDMETGGQAYWRDVGNLDSYWAANLELIGVTPELNLYNQDWPIWTYQEQAPPAKFVFDEKDRRGMAVDSMVAGGCIVSGALVRHSLLFSNVVVDQGATVEESVVLPDVHVGAGCRIRRVIVETGCRVPPGTVIGHDPQADASRFEISAGGVALVTPEMLGQDLPYVR
ncbi:MAG TPA: glucose-1-phosphate adenylyltransferase [Gammaproteobacteria bacterium]|nr:glucose-1-phosphate adenylyltransferase [Gammaproteobacteria bacterium]